jgi:type III pantothenate kinase
MPNLVIDIGNTFTKFAVFEHDELLWATPYESVGPELTAEIINRYQVKQAIISTVKKAEQEWQAFLAEKIPVIYFNRQMLCGVKNLYRSPQTLGLDRLAAVIGAVKCFPQQNNLVIDAGTCITYEWVDKAAAYHGGSISPGISMRYKAMHAFTAGLPLVEKNDQADIEYGDDTTSAMRSGVQTGVKYEVLGFIDNYARQNPQLNIILTGGDGIFLYTLLKNSIFAPYIKNEPYLVLKGLNAAIQEHND